MANESVWPAAGFNNILVSGTNIQQFTAGDTVKAGMVVGIIATGPTVARTVVPAVVGTTVTIVGVAIEDASNGEEFSVACRGCLAYVVNSLDNAAIEAGAPIGAAASGGTAGCVATVTLTVGGGQAITPIVGYALETGANYTSGLHFLADIAPGVITTALA